MVLPGKASEISRIEPVPLRTVVADMLRTAIVNGTLKPGTPVVELTLADQLHVSRATVREAIQVLEGDGLIETLPFKGKRVRPLTPAMIEELYSLREQFELFAVRRILEAGAAVSGLRAYCEAMVRAADRGDRGALVLADAAFHRALLELADHQLLLGLWDNLALRIRQVMALRNLENSDLREVAQSHLPIVEALEGRDLASAIALISSHARPPASFQLPSGA